MITTASCAVVAVYEDAATREKALRFCDSLVQQYWAETQLQVSWYGFEALTDEEASADAATKARVADLVVFSLLPPGDVPIELKAWVGRWAESRGEREGAIVGLGDPAGYGGTPTAKFVWLRRQAHKAGLDYLTKAPPTMTLPFPEAPQPYTDRATQSSTILDDILKRRCPPNCL